MVVPVATAVVVTPMVVVSMMAPTLAMAAVPALVVPVAAAPDLDNLGTAPEARAIEEIGLSSDGGPEHRGCDERGTEQPAAGLHGSDRHDDLLLFPLAGSVSA